MIKLRILVLCLCGVSLIGCSKKTPETLSFTAYWHGQPVLCDQSLTSKLEVSTFQFYLSNLMFDEKGAEQGAFAVSDNSIDNTAMVGMDAAACDQQNWQLVLKDGIPENAKTLSFEMAIPFKLNHANPLAQEPPINNSRMFWSWQLGHKFLRLDLASKSREWSFHLGSTGCYADSKLRAPTLPCVRPHRYRVQIDLPPFFDGRINIDLDKLLTGVDFDRYACMSDNENRNCQVLFSTLANLPLTPVFSAAD